METKHTPGEWVTGSTDPLLFGRKQGNGTEPIGCVYGPAFPERSDVGQRALANARLIAAAPELLDALKSLVQLEADGKHADECAIETWGRAAATIAKAEGR